MSFTPFTTYAVAVSPTKIRLVFGAPVSNDAFLVDAASYTVTNINGDFQTIASAALEAAISGSTPTVIALVVSPPMGTTQTYQVVISPNVTFFGGGAIVPSHVTLKWVDPLKNFTVPISEFGGEVEGGLFGTHDGLVFFSPALATSTANSIIQVDQVEVCTTAYDKYTFPQLVDPTPLYTYSPNSPLSRLGPDSVLFASWQRLSEFQVNFDLRPSDDMPQAASHGVRATLREPWDHTYVSLLNNIDWKTFDNASEPPFFFKTAFNAAPIPPGPEFTIVLETFPTAFDFDISDTIGVVDQTTHSGPLAFADAMDLTESVAVEDNESIFLTDSAISVADSTAISVAVVRSSSDSSTVTDQVLVGLELTRTLSDTASTSDSVDTSSDLELLAEDDSTLLTETDVSLDAELPSEILSETGDSLGTEDGNSLDSD